GLRRRRQGDRTARRRGCVRRRRQGHLHGVAQLRAPVRNAGELRQCLGAPAAARSASARQAWLALGLPSRAEQPDRRRAGHARVRRRAVRFGRTRNYQDRDRPHLSALRSRGRASRHREEDYRWLDAAPSVSGSAHRGGLGASALTMPAMWARWGAMTSLNSFAPPRVGVCAVALSLASMSWSSAAETMSAPIFSRSSAETAGLPNKPTSPSI